MYLLQDNQISTVPAGSLPADLSEIFLDNNPVLTIDNSAFDITAPTLQTVSFDNARFTRIPDVFLHVTSLSTFTLANTNIQDWNDGVMKHIGQTTKTLQLDNVGFTQWPTWMQYFVKLSDLTITNTAISNISDNGLISMADTLKSLSLTSNSLTSVPKALMKLNTLQMLYLHDNAITDIQWLSQVGKLYSLSLNNNQINNATSLSQALHTFADTLYDFQIHHNALTEIPDMSFLHGVTSLDLSYNEISDATSGALPPELFSLNLEDNGLPYFPNYISKLPAVTTFIANTNAFTVLVGSAWPPETVTTELAYNLITELTDASFPEDSKIQNLNLNDNPIYQISTSAFKNLPHLTVLYLRRTKLTRLPLALTSLTSLTFFDISGTRGVVCTCAENSVATVILSMKRENVKGECGPTNIYKFFTTFSSSCP